MTLRTAATLAVGWSVGRRTGAAIAVTSGSSSERCATYPPGPT